MSEKDGVETEHILAMSLGEEILALFKEKNAKTIVSIRALTYVLAMITYNLCNKNNGGDCSPVVEEITEGLKQAVDHLQKINSEGKNESKK